MKVLHLNYADQIGGAAVSVMRLHKSLMEKNINSNLLIIEKTTNEKNLLCETSTFSKIKDLIKKALLRFLNKISNSENKETFQSRKSR